MRVTATVVAGHRNVRRDRDYTLSIEAAIGQVQGGCEARRTGADACGRCCRGAGADGDRAGDHGAGRQGNADARAEDGAVFGDGHLTLSGADVTVSIEAMMQDRKALQAGTSHFLGQNFAKAQEIKFQNEAGELQYAFTTSWGVSTRLVGGLIMTHSDDQGLVMPPRLAPTQVVMVPIFRNDDEQAAADGHFVHVFVERCEQKGQEFEIAGRLFALAGDTKTRWNALMESIAPAAPRPGMTGAFPAVSAPR